MTNMLLALLARLSAIHSNVFYELTDNGNLADAEKYPYVIFDVLPLSQAEVNREDNIIEIDVWDKTTNPIPLEELTTSLSDSLKDWQHLDDGQLFWLEFVSRGSIPDPDAAIRRRQIRYRVKRYQR